MGRVTITRRDYVMKGERNEKNQKPQKRDRSTENHKEAAERQDNNLGNSLHLLPCLHHKVR
jgi:hypothetical protein